MNARKPRVSVSSGPVVSIRRSGPNPRLTAIGGLLAAFDTASLQEKSAGSRTVRRVGIADKDFQAGDALHLACFRLSWRFDMKGVQFLFNAKGRRTGVLIDLVKNPDLWEDMFDRALARKRTHEPRESFAVVKKRLQRIGKLPANRGE